MNLLATPPQAVSRNIARAKSLVRREEPIRALEALITGLELYDPAQLMGKARFEIEVLIQECVNELNRLPQVRSFLIALAKSDKVALAYTPGKEDQLKKLLPILRKGLEETEAAGRRSEHETREARKTMLQEKGLNFLKAGDAPRGKGALRVLGDEFGDEPGVLVEIGQWLVEAKLYFEAAEFLEQSIGAFPKESRAYAAAADCYLTLREFDKAEAVYLRATKEFGKHPKTMLNLARLYVQWGKRDKAFETARDVLAKDPNNAEAKEIVERFA